MTESHVQVVSASISDRGLSEKRPQNEDSFLEVPRLNLYAVADGVGGAQAGDVASQMAVEILSEAFANLQRNGDAEDMMKLAIERANEAIFQVQADLPQLASMATTIVALHLDGQIATIGHVGDSRLYRLDAKGSLYRETQDHSLVEEAVRSGRMTPEQAEKDPMRNVISRALGAEATVEVDLKTIMFDTNSTFLLCSDGITRHITDYELRELLLSPAEPAVICEKMKEICYSRGAEDNLTAVVIRTAERVSDSLPIDDELTVQSARPIETGELEIPTQALELPEAVQNSTAFSAASDDEAYLMADDTVAETTNEVVTDNSPALADDTAASATSTVAAAAATTAVGSSTVINFPSGYADANDEESSKGSLAGRLLKSLLLLLVGLALGGGGVYYWLTKMAPVASPPAPQIREMESANPAFTAFEKLRRELEVSPEKVIAGYETAKPADAADFYLLAKAYLYMKRYEDAKKNFIEARNRLTDYPETANKAVLASDIAVGLAAASDKATQTAFERERSFPKPPGQ